MSSLIEHRALSQHWRPKSRAVLSFALLSVLLVPPLFFYLAEASSMALGATLAAALVLVMSVDPSAVYRWSHGPKVGFPTVLVVLIVLGVALHSVVSALFLPFDWMRAAASVVPLVLVLWSGYAFGRVLGVSTEASIHGAMRVCFAVFCLIGALAVVNVLLGNAHQYAKPVFPFTEPSYFALAFLPLLMYRSVMLTGSARVLALLIGLAAALLLQSLTLLLGCLLIAGISFRPAAVLLPIVCVPLAATQLDLGYYLQRLNFSSETENLSSLVYVQGWQLITESVVRSGGWGLGFQQLGVQGTDVWAAVIIYELTGDYSNVLAGGFTFAKLVSEFGVIGLLLTVLYLFVARRAIRELRSTARNPRSSSAALTLSRCVITSYLLELFVRGGGYFAGTSILLVASLWLSAPQQRRIASCAEPVPLR